MNTLAVVAGAYFIGAITTFMVLGLAVARLGGRMHDGETAQVAATVILPPAMRRSRG
jgi:hypothetical protein